MQLVAGPSLRSDQKVPAVPDADGSGADRLQPLSGISDYYYQCNHPDHELALGPLLTRLVETERETLNVAEELTRHYEEIDLLYTISAVLGRTIGLKEAASVIVQEVSKVVGARRASILVDDAEHRTLRPVAGWGVDVSHFTPIPIDDEVSVAARVQHRTEDKDNDGSRRFGFRFLEPQQLNARLPAAARRLFNRRQTVRVAPDQFQPVGVTIEPCDPGSDEPQSPVEVRLLNISVAGIAVSLEPTLETAFAATTHVNLVVKLPGVRRALELVGDIRYRRLIGQRIHYGIQFNADQTERFDRKQDILAKYVTRRQLDYLRASA